MFLYFLAKLETLTEDSNFIAAAANITMSLPWNNKQLVESAKVRKKYSWITIYQP